MKANSPSALPLTRRFALGASLFGLAGFSLKAQACEEGAAFGQAFRRAAQEGDLEKVHGFLERDPSLMWSRDERGISVSVLALLAGHQALVHFLLERGVPQSLPTSIIAGDLGRAKQLLEEDPLRIHERGPHDFPLGYYPSFAGGDLEAAQLLLERGLDLAAERSGATVLHLAARQGHRELAELWLRHGADPDAKSRGEKPMTALEVARERGQQSVAELLEKV